MPTLTLMPNGISVSEHTTQEVSNTTWEWALKIIMQTKDAYLKLYPGSCVIDTSNPAVTELLHDLAFDSLPLGWNITRA